jgi:hypothetical protein
VWFLAGAQPPNIQKYFTLMFSASTTHKIGGDDDGFAGSQSARSEGKCWPEGNEDIDASEDDDAKRWGVEASGRG